MTKWIEHQVAAALSVLHDIKPEGYLDDLVRMGRVKRRTGKTICAAVVGRKPNSDLADERKQHMNTFDISRRERLLTAEEIARMLNISRAKVYRLIQQGKIPVIRISRAGSGRFPRTLQEYAKRSHTGDSEG